MVGARVSLRVLLSTVLALLWSVAATAHEVRPAISDLTLTADRVVLEVEASAEAMIAGVDLSVYSDTNEAPEAEAYDRLRALLPNALEDAFREAWPRLAEGIDLRAGDTRLEPRLQDVSVAFVDDPDLTRDTTFTVSADLPPGAVAVTVGWAPAFGPLVVRQMGGGEDAYTAYLEPGDRSAPIARPAGAAGLAAMVLQGAVESVPMGLDHVLFVLGLVVLSQSAAALSAQVAAFLAMAVGGLWLGALGGVPVSAQVVEPLIALSVVAIGLATLLRWEPGGVRAAFAGVGGGLHGLGLSGGAASASPLALGAFSLGAVLGLLVVAMVGALVLRVWLGSKPFYRRAIAVPLSLVVAGLGAVLLLERTLLA